MIKEKSKKETSKEEVRHKRHHDDKIRVEKKKS